MTDRDFHKSFSLMEQLKLETDMLSALCVIIAEKVCYILEATIKISDSGRSAIYPNDVRKLVEVDWRDLPALIYQNG